MISVHISIGGLRTPFFMFHFINIVVPVSFKKFHLFLLQFFVVRILQSTKNIMSEITFFSKEEFPTEKFKAHKVSKYRKYKWDTLQSGEGFCVPIPKSGRPSIPKHLRKDFEVAEIDNKVYFYRK